MSEKEKEGEKEFEHVNLRLGLYLVSYFDHYVHVLYRVFVEKALNIFLYCLRF